MRIRIHVQFPEWNSHVILSSNEFKFTKEFLKRKDQNESDQKEEATAEVETARELKRRKVKKNKDIESPVSTEKTDTKLEEVEKEVKSLKDLVMKAVEKVDKGMKIYSKSESLSSY